MGGAPAALAEQQIGVRRGNEEFYGVLSRLTRFGQHAGQQGANGAERSWTGETETTGSGEVPGESLSVLDTDDPALPGRVYLRRGVGFLCTCLAPGPFSQVQGAYDRCQGQITAVSAARAVNNAPTTPNDQ
ncbi:hypothetical protein ACFWP5_40360 [Streptomyces sp. NPDC058469]|uniref:hypothetical protein n=1 Tax=Streptomyces sp. NPDC058469 TaxID=3346514 RepID=UPI0036592B7C